MYFFNVCDIKEELLPKTSQTTSFVLRVVFHISKTYFPPIDTEEEAHLSRTRPSSGFSFPPPRPPDLLFPLISSPPPPPPLVTFTHPEHPNPIIETLLSRDIVVRLLTPSSLLPPFLPIFLPPPRHEPRYRNPL